MKQPNNGAITALYERLSKDDEQKSDSVSIAHQKQILEDYAQKNGFPNIRHFTDDGVRGTTFKRPGLDAMLDEIRAGNVATVIIKDQSRIGRDVVEVGLLKRTFEEYNVRFIAAEDGLDTAKGFDIMSVFRDVFNEFYVADTSRKIKAVFKSRMEKGLRCSGSIPYGYLAGKEDTKEWIIDEEAAAVVRRIFQSIIDGIGINDIGRALRAEQIPIPSAHWERIGAPVRAAGYADPYAWSATTIGGILKRPEYMGRMILGKTVCENYRTKTHRKTAPEEQFIFDGAIPAIVDEETWNNAQRLRKTVRRPPKREGAPHRLTGLLYCSDCGSKMTRRYNLVQKKWVDDSYICSSYRQLTRDCTMHHIPTKKMEAAILTAIQRVSWYVREHEKEFIQRVREASTVQQEETVKDSKRRLSQSQRRHTELDGLVKKLYEANATGKINDRHFDRMMAEYDEEQAGLEAAINELQGQIGAWSEDELKTDRFIELVKRYTDFTELTTPMLNEFIEKVIVYEGEGRGNARRQSIDICMNFIGAFEVPAEIVTPLELAEQRRIQEETAAHDKEMKEREQARYDKRNQEKREFTARKKAGLLTPEEAEAEEQRLVINRAWQKEWRDKRKAAEPPKPPKQPSKKAVIQDIVARNKEGLPLTPEETEIYAAHREKENEKFRKRRARIKASEPPKPKKLTIKAVLEQRKEGLPLTAEGEEIYKRFRENRNEKLRDYNREYQREYMRERREKAKTEAADLPMAANQ